ncbi:zinc finger, CCHC-type, Retrotransposon gag domain protein [Artemisia annua]|uniref:Zinc finger, CCHC-type, Retrotransposon gag domain protein n=1 Tax=Artemisia annua TaxID=35608 RepID=A0A2U1L0J2_ARTAN|nr:zinc finger, CCHC-type, Retrotransposon gag domain protein [Artemisia annua]
MVTTRQTDEFTSNPAFEAAVQRWVDALMPSITARIAIEMERNRAGTSGGSSGSNPPNDITTWLGKFSKEKPKSFSSVTSPSEAEDWLGHIEKIFEVLACGDEFKARLAAYKFEGDALNWGKSYKAAKGDDFMNTLTWAGFRVIFLLHYFPLSEQEKFEREYHNIYQYENETSTAFMKRFLRLAGFMGAKAGSQAEQAKKFKWALRDEVLEGIVNMHFDDVAQVANAVRNLEILKERGKQGVKRNYDGEPVRPAQGNAQRRNEFRVMIVGLLTLGDRTGRVMIVVVMIIVSMIGGTIIGVMMLVGMTNRGITIRGQAVTYSSGVNGIIELQVHLDRRDVRARLPARIAGSCIRVYSAIRLLGLVSYVVIRGTWRGIVLRRVTTTTEVLVGIGSQLILAEFML